MVGLDVEVIFVGDVVESVFFLGLFVEEVVVVGLLVESVFFLDLVVEEVVFVE